MTTGTSGSLWTGRAAVGGGPAGVAGSGAGAITTTGGGATSAVVRGAAAAGATVLAAGVSGAIARRGAGERVAAGVEARVGGAPTGSAVGSAIAADVASTAETGTASGATEGTAADGVTGVLLERVISQVASGAPITTTAAAAMYRGARLRAGPFAGVVVRAASITGAATTGRADLGTTGGCAAGCGARVATGAVGKGRGVASIVAAGATGRTGCGVGALGIGAVSRVGPALGGVGRRCGTSEPPKTPLEGCDGLARGAVAAVGAAGRGAGFGACGADGIRPAPRGRGPAMKVVWGGRPHWT